jgi:glycosyltransferase involved in cell wall biosynthesis
VLLESLRVACIGLARQPEILVCDNASPDDTGAAVAEFGAKGLALQYIRRPENIGGENNFYRSVEIASGEYVWVIGDDDKIRPDGIKKILEYLEGGHNLLLLNYSVYNDSFDKLRMARKFGYKRDLQFRSSDELLAQFGLHLGYISSVVIKRETFLRLPFAEYTELAQYGFPFAYAVYAGLKTDGCNALFVNEALLLNMGDNSGDYDWYKYFVEGSHKIFGLLMQRGYSSSSAQKADTLVLRDYVIYRVVNERIAGLFSQEYASLLDKCYNNNMFFWFVVKPLIWCPSSVLAALKKIALAARWLRKKFALGELYGFR